MPELNPFLPVRLRLPSAKRRLPPRGKPLSFREVVGKRSALLVIVNLTAKGSTFPLEALLQVDLALETVGLKKQVRSVLAPGKQFSVTYEGTSIEKSGIEETLKPLAERNQITIEVEIEESVSFP